MANVDEIDEVITGYEPAPLVERVVVSPGKGRFFPSPPEIFTTEGEWVQEGQVLGEVRNGSASVPIISSFTGWMMGMLALTGQPVTTGDHLFWIRP